MEIATAMKTVAKSDRIKENVRCIVEQNARVLANEIRKKIHNLEFYEKEDESKKKDLTEDVSSMNFIKNRIEQTRKSLQYPEEICIKCIEIRGSIPQSNADEVQQELRKEVKLIEQTREFFTSSIENLEEQLRKHRSIIYTLTNGVQRKRIAQRIDKQNESLKITDFDIVSREDVSTPSQILTPTSANFNSEWMQNNERVLKQATDELKNGQKMMRLLEESMLTKISQLTNQHDRTNEIFCKRTAQYKDIKNCLEINLSKINELLPAVKKTIGDLQDEIIETELRLKLTRIRLQKRTESNVVELNNDEVERILFREMNRLKVILIELHQKRQEAYSSLILLNKQKSGYESEIQSQINTIKIDEVECLSLRSSIHYHSY